jgi:hypothetical protein
LASVDSGVEVFGEQVQGGGGLDSVPGSENESV